jgi:asparagine synthetase A
VRQILQAIHEALTQTVARVKKAFRKPPLLEGDINFIELEHPEFVFMRLPDEDGNTVLSF